MSSLTARLLPAVGAAVLLLLVSSGSVTADPDPPANPGVDESADRPSAIGRLRGNEIAILRELNSRFYRRRMNAARRLARLSDDRAVVTLSHALRDPSARVRTAAAQEAARRDPLPGLADPLLDLLRDEAVDMDGPCFRAARDAFFRLGPHAETAFEEACDNGLLTDAPELEGFFQRMAREALPAVIDRIREPEGGVLLMPWQGQFTAVLKPEWIGILEGMVREGAATLARVGRPAIPFLTDAPPEIRRGALACFALGEWAAVHPDHAERIAHTLREAHGMVPGFTPSMHWIRGPREQLTFALAAVLHRVGESRPLQAVHRMVSVRLQSLEANHERSEVPKAWFILRLHQALYCWWMDNTAAAASAFRDALQDLQMTAGSGVEREVIAHAHVLWARVQADLRQSGDDDITPEVICETLEQAGEYGLRDTAWLEAVSEFTPLRATTRFRDLITRLAAPEVIPDGGGASEDDDDDGDGERASE